MTTKQLVALRYKLLDGGHTRNGDDNRCSTVALHVLNSADINNFFQSVDEGVYGVSGKQKRHRKCAAREGVRDTKPKIRRRARNLYRIHKVVSTSSSTIMSPNREKPRINFVN